MSYTDKDGKVWACDPVEEGDLVEYIRITPQALEMGSFTGTVVLQGGRFLARHASGHGMLGNGTDGYTRPWNILERDGKPYVRGPVNFKLTGFGVAAAGGCVCKRCNSLNEYAAPNQKDGKSYLCYSCRV